MPDMRETLKYTFTVEGETEQWYLLWLRDQINACPDREKNISIVPKVQQSPAKFYKSTSRKVTPVVTHICDVENNKPIHVSKFQTILSEMKDAQTNKRIDYHLGYSNFSFELWMVLHKKDFNCWRYDCANYIILRIDGWLCHVCRFTAISLYDKIHVRLL